MTPGPPGPVSLRHLQERRAKDWIWRNPSSSEWEQKPATKAAVGKGSKICVMMAC